MSKLQVKKTTICEIGRLSALGAQYAEEFMTFAFSAPKSVLILSVRREMFQRGMKQKEAAKFLGVQEPAFSRFLRGKTKPSFDLARQLYTKFQIKPDLIFEV